MGYVKIKALVSDLEKKRSKEVEFLADTGAGYMVVTPDLAKDLGLEELAQKLNLPKTRVTLADKREVEAQQTFCYVRVMDREAPVTVLVMDCPMPLFGAFTLQVLGLEVDPVTEKTRSSRPFSLGIMYHSA